MSSNSVFDELMTIRGREDASVEVEITGRDPVLPTRYPLGESAAGIMASIGVAVSDLWELKTGRRQSCQVSISHAAAALRSYQYLKVAGESASPAWQTQQQRQRISTPHPTRDGRYFLPHMGLPHLAERVLGVLGCEYELDAVTAAVARWDALALENAIADVKACGAMVRSALEWQAHPHGQALAAMPVIEVIKIGDSDPIPMPAGDDPLSGIRVLDLTRILAGPTCARTLAEHGADVLMVTAEHLPQSERFVMDTSHGKRSCYLNLKEAGQLQQLQNLIQEADIFSQGYRPGVMQQLGLSPEDLAQIKPGVIYTSMNCYGFEGPFRQRAGWEQLAQTVTGIAHEHGGDQPQLLPAAACDYTTGYLAAYGTLLALDKRAREGGSYHVRASLCQSGMMLQRQHRVDYDDPGLSIAASDLSQIMMESDTPYGMMQHLGPILKMSETKPHWTIPSSPLGSHSASWLN